MQNFSIVNLTHNTTLIENLSLGLVTDYLDYIGRIVALLIHVVYVLFIIYFKEFQTRTMLYLHHVNIISLIFCIHYVFYIGNQTASFTNNQANDIFCYLSELLWINLKFLRMYSLLLLAVYRYTSVFKIQFYREYNSKLFKLILPLVLVWLFSLLMSFSLRYIFSTSHSIYFCYEGYSAYWLNSVLFFIFLITISYVIPSITVIVLYKKIIDKLKDLTKNLNKNKTVENEKTSSYLKMLSKIRRNNRIALMSVFAITSSNEQQQTPKSEKNKKNETQNYIQIRENKNPKQRRFAQQMVLINLITCVGSVFSVLTNIQVTLSTNPYFDHLNLLLQNVSPIFRIIFLAIQSAIPVISIIYSPWAYSWREIKKKLTISEILTTSKAKQ